MSVLFSIVSTAAAKTSFQETTKANTADAAMPGVTSGSTTLTKACSRVQPSVQAASLELDGHAHEQRGRDQHGEGHRQHRVHEGEAEDRIVEPDLMYATASGRARSGSGKARVIRTRIRKTDLPTKSKRASA